MMKLILVRHGDPDYPNDCLTPMGLAQARGLTKTFRNIDVHARPGVRKRGSQIPCCDSM
jgi:probable phosphoglycerate mutase